MSKSNDPDYDFSDEADQAILEQADPEFADRFRHHNLGSYWLIEFRKLVTFIRRQAGHEAADHFIKAELDSRK